MIACSLFELRLPTAVDPDLDVADADDERDEHNLDDTTPADELKEEISASVIASYE